jgi:hypothetical protein
MNLLSRRRSYIMAHAAASALKRRRGCLTGHALKRRKRCVTGHAAAPARRRGCVVGHAAALRRRGCVAGHAAAPTILGEEAVWRDMQLLLLGEEAVYCSGTCSCSY